MGMYISQTDLEDTFGTSNVRQWSNLDNTTGSANTSRIAAAIDWAESRVNDRLRGGKYTVPISAGAYSLPTLKAWCTGLAAWRLYIARGLRDQDQYMGQLQGHHDLVEKELDDVLSGVTSPDFAISRASQPTAPTVVE